MGRHAVIDVGTNSMKLHIADVEGTRVTAIADRTEVTRLGEGLRPGGELLSSAIERNLRVLREFVAAARGCGVTDIVVVGTMALRAATNRDEFIRRVRAEQGLNVEVISGDEEARLACVASLTGLGPVYGNVCIFDTGGGSTEFIFLLDGELQRSFSLAIGARRLTEEILKSDPVTAAETAKLNRTIDDLIVLENPTVDRLIGIGGTITSLGSIMHGMKKYDPAKIQGTRLAGVEIDRQIELFASLTVEKRREIVGLMPKRADVILAGASIVRSVMRKTNCTEVLISDHGLRHGLIHDRFVGEG